MNTDFLNQREINVIKLVSVLRYKADIKSWHTLGRPFHCIAFEVAEGNIHTVEQGIINVRSGDVLFLAKGQEYDCRVKEGGSECIVVHFDTDSDQKFDSKVYKILDIEQMNSLFRMLERVYFERRPGWYAESMSMLYRIISCLIDNSLENPKEPYTKSQIQRASEIVHLNLSKPDFNVEALASEMTLSRQAICNMFNRVYGMSPFRYIQQLRLEYAKNLLKESFYSISDIAYQCGYSSLYVFSRSFKAEEGVSPKEYRIMQSYLREVNLPNDK